MVARNCWMGKATCCTMCYKLTPAEKQRCSGQIGQGSAWLLGTSAFQSAIKQSEKCLWHQATTRSRHANYWWRILSQWRAKRSGERSERCGSSLHWHGTKSCALELMTLNAMMGNYLWARRQFLVLTAFLLQLIGSDAYLQHTGSFIKQMMRSEHHTANIWVMISTAISSSLIIRCTPVVILTTNVCYY